LRETLHEHMRRYVGVNLAWENIARNIPNAQFEGCPQTSDN